jgi:hypothetical protein
MAGFETGLDLAQTSDFYRSSQAEKPAVGLAEIIASLGPIQT